MRVRSRFLTMDARVDVFGAYLQDLPDSVMAPIVVNGYRHFVPAVVQAKIEELYRTGASTGGGS